MKIQIQKGSISPGDVQEYHLVSNHLLSPDKNIDRVIMYAERRHLMTLLTSGARDSKYTAPGYTPKGGDTVSTKIKEIPEGEMVNGNAWSYKIMGRIQKAVDVVGTATVGNPTIGTSQKGGTFKMYLADDYISPSMVCTFPNGKQARVMSRPVGQTGRFLYTFECFPGDTFDWSTWINVGIGKKTIFGGYSIFGERSRRGYGVFHYPDRFIQHTTTQRKSISISGHANANEVYWYELDGAKGFVYEAEAQMRAQFLLEDEFQKWFGVSTMRDQYGNLLSRPSMQDEKGDDIYAGDGFVQQIRGANDMENSGADGSATIDDYSDMVKQLTKKKDWIEGNSWVVVTGSDGLETAEAAIYAKYGSNVQLTQNVSGQGGIGGEEITYGYRFRKLNIAGNQITFVVHPMFDDEERFPMRLTNGKLRQSSTYYWMDLSPREMNSKTNVEIRARGRKGVNRNIVYHWENGMTGEGTAQNPVDDKSFHMLKENMIVVYDIRTHGIQEPSLTA